MSMVLKWYSEHVATYVSKQIKCFSQNIFDSLIVCCCCVVFVLLSGFPKAADSKNNVANQLDTFFSFYASLTLVELAQCDKQIKINLHFSL